MERWLKSFDIPFNLSPSLKGQNTFSYFTFLMIPFAMRSCLDVRGQPKAAKWAQILFDAEAKSVGVLSDQRYQEVFSEAGYGIHDKHIDG